MIQRVWPARDSSGTPVMIQHQEAECGAVALAIVLAHHGCWPGLPEVRERCGVTRFGCNAANLLSAAKMYGLDARAVRLPAGQLAHLPTPAILFWRNAHFLVLERVAGDRAWLNDPALGRRSIDLAELAEGYSGVALPMTPGSGFHPSGSRPRPLREIAAVARTARGALLILTVAIVAEASAWAWVAVTVAGWADQPTGFEATAVAPAAVATAVVIVTTFVQGRLLDRAIFAIAVPRVDAYLDDLAHLPPAFVDLRQPAELGGRVRLPEALATVSADAASVLVRSVAIVAIWIGVLASESWLLAVSWATSLGLATVIEERRDRTDRTAAARRALLFGRRAVLEAEVLHRTMVTRANGEELQALAGLVAGGDDALKNPPPIDAVRAWAAFGIILALPILVVGGLAHAGSAAGTEAMLTLFAVAAGLRVISAPATLRRAWDLGPRMLRQMYDSRDERRYRANRPEPDGATA